MNKITRAGVDIAKSVFHVCATDRHGNILWQAKLSRKNWLTQLDEHLEPGSEIGMEACGGSHHWARVLQAKGYRVKLIAAQFVKPYVKGNKNDHLDAAAIAEAMARPNMRFVAVKSTAQQDLQALHRVRSERVCRRTAKVNQIRGLMAEFGIVAPRGIQQLRQAIPCWLEDGENGISGAFRVLLSELQEELIQMDCLVDRCDVHIAKAVKEDPVASRLSQLRGVGPLTASALSIALGDGSAFRNGREFAASVGLVPRQHSTGGRTRLLGISKRGDNYLRTLLIHGARSVLRFAPKWDDPLSRWLNQMLLRRHRNVVSVALANKTARTAWAMVRYERDYDSSMMSAAAS